MAQINPAGGMSAPAPDHAGAVAYALDRLRAELPDYLHYHNLAHTRDDVLPAAIRLATLSHVSEPDTRLLEVAAAFHDVGQIHLDMGHEALGTEIIDDVLPGFGFSGEDITRIAAMIMATRLPQTPLNELEALLADADLDSLGREDFLATSVALWRERAERGTDIPWPTWLQHQIAFLTSHRYFTPAARQLRDAGKRGNIARLEDLIARGTRPDEIPA